MRTYTCHECGKKFQTDRLTPLPVIDMVCDDCKRRTNIYIFTNRKTGNDVVVRASEVELATLRAWQIDSNLPFKVPQSDALIKYKKTQYEAEQTSSTIETFGDFAITIYLWIYYAIQEVR